MRLHTLVNSYPLPSLMVFTASSHVFSLKSSSPLQDSQVCTHETGVGKLELQVCGMNWAEYGGVSFRMAGFNSARFNMLLCCKTHPVQIEWVAQQVASICKKLLYLACFLLLELMKSMLLIRAAERIGGGKANTKSGAHKMDCVRGSGGMSP